MNFIKYTKEGKTIIQSAALILSGLEKEDVLEMHTLDNVLVLVKDKMPPQEKVKTMCSLMRLVNSLTADLMCGFEEEGEDEFVDETDLDDAEDMFLVPAWVLEDEEIMEKLGIRLADSEESDTAGEKEGSVDKTERDVSKCLFKAAVALNTACDLLNSAYADD